MKFHSVYQNLNKLQILILLQLFSSFIYGSRVTIISSQFEHTGQNMDSIWYQVVLKMGHQPIIVPQSTLDNGSFFSTSDILIVSNAEIGLTPIAVDNMINFIKSGKSVYIQSEWLPNYTTNLAFKFIVNSLGGSFNWGDLYDDYIAMNILGTYASNQNKVESVICYHSVAGTGDCNTINILEFAGENHGWQYIAPNTAFGSIITIADQDWILEKRSLPFMENIIENLIFPPSLPGENIIYLGADTFLCEGKTLVLDVTSMNADYLWNDNSILPFYTVNREGTYWVNVNLSCGTVSDSITVAIEQCECNIYVPNVFSPNDDNVNDLFLVESDCVLNNYSIQIFDRVGNLVFESGFIDSGWDGVFHSKKLPTGVYAYKISYSVNQIVKVKIGDVTLLY